MGTIYLFLSMLSIPMLNHRTQQIHLFSSCFLMVLPKCRYISVVFFAFVVLLINNGVEAFHKVYPHLQSVSTISVSGQHRTAYHFQPPKNWINGSYATLFNLDIYLSAIYFILFNVILLSLSNILNDFGTLHPFEA